MRTFQDALNEVERINFQTLINNIIDNEMMMDTELAGVLNIGKQRFAKLKYGQEPTFSEGQDIINMHEMSCRHLHKLENICE